MGVVLLDPDWRTGAAVASDGRLEAGDPLDAAVAT